MCIFNIFPGDADAAGLGTTFWDVAHFCVVSRPEQRQENRGRVDLEQRTTCFMKGAAGSHISVTTFVGLSFLSYKMRTLYGSSSSFCDPMDPRLQNREPRSLINLEGPTSHGGSCSWGCWLASGGQSFTDLCWVTWMESDVCFLIVFPVSQMGKDINSWLFHMISL